MKKSEYPDWLVPLEIARKLKEIGMTNSEILVCNDEYYGWYRNEEIYDYDNDGDFITYTALEASNWKNSNLEPTYTWDQVFKWFRSKNLIGWVECQGNPEMEYYTRIFKEGINYYRKGKRKLYSSYEKARNILLNELIIVYKEFYGNK